MRVFFRPTLGVVALLSLAGCTEDWPSYGHGGIAELRPIPLKPEAAALNLQLSCFKGLIDRYKASDAAAYSNATLPRAETLSARISREIAGGLLPDARYDMETLKVMVVDLTDAAEMPTDKVDQCAAS
ncbi:MAG: hypothetical protein JWO51_1583 [Rhodospirillales bacterium]|nr:hypothetical protein [Rhodospirillales bacterium]